MVCYTLHAWFCHRQGRAWLAYSTCLLVLRCRTPWCAAAIPLQKMTRNADEQAKVLLHAVSTDSLAGMFFGYCTVPHIKVQMHLMFIMPWQHYTSTCKYVTVAKHMAPHGKHSFYLVAPTWWQHTNSPPSALSGLDCISWQRHRHSSHDAFGRKTDHRLMDFLLQQIAPETLGSSLLVVAEHGRRNFQLAGIRLRVRMYCSLQGHILQEPHYGVSIVPADDHISWSIPT